MISILDEYKKTLNVINTIINDKVFLDKVNQVAELWLKALRMNHKILFCGNGGSAADSQHLAAELVSRFYFDRPGLNAIALTVDSSIITAIGNDYGYEKIFSRQVEAIGQSGDILVGLSTSGKSKNVLEAFKCAKSKNITTIAFLGDDGRDIAKFADYSINIPSSFTPKIQEAHIITAHIICSIVEERFFGKNN